MGAECCGTLEEGGAGSFRAPGADDLKAGSQDEPGSSRGLEASTGLGKDLWVGALSWTAVLFSLLTRGWAPACLSLVPSVRGGAGELLVSVSGVFHPQLRQKLTLYLT